MWESSLSSRYMPRFVVSHATPWSLDLARIGEGERAREALIRAQRTTEKLVEQQDELAGPFTCSIGRAGGFWSDAHLALGEAREALAYADRAVSSFEATPGDLRNFGSERMVRCQQVKAHLILGELDGAQESLAPILDTAPEYRVLPLLQRVTEISKMVADGKYAAALPAAQIREAVTDFRIDHASKAPPPTGKEE